MPEPKKPYTLSVIFNHRKKQIQLAEFILKQKSWTDPKFHYKENERQALSLLSNSEITREYFEALCRKFIENGGDEDKFRTEFNEFVREEQGPSNTLEEYFK